MRNIILRDKPQIHAELLPITFTRPVSEILTGLLSIRAHWQHLIPGQYSYAAADFLEPSWPMREAPDGDNLIITSHFIPSPQLAQAILSLSPSQTLISGDEPIAWRGLPSEIPADTVVYEGPLASITHTYDIFRQCSDAIEAQFELVTQGRQSLPVAQSCTVIGPPDRIFIEDGASVEGAFLNTTSGPIYIGSRAEVMEGACLRGPIALLDDAHINMGARIYGPTAIGQFCKIGGEVNNAVIHPYTNKAHDGFLGNAVIGSWCNLGAGCTASNLKNDYTEIKLWNYPTRRFLRTGLQFCGLIMGDHSKAGINTMFNTATVVGVGVNIHGTGFPRNFVASFSEGSATTGFTDVSMTKFAQIAKRVMARRGITFTDADLHMFETIRDIADTYK